MIRLLLYNLGTRLQEIAELTPLCGEALVDHIKARWQSPNRPKVTP